MSVSEEIVVNNDRNNKVIMKVLEQGTGIAVEYDATLTFVADDDTEQEIRLGTTDIENQIEDCLQKMNAGMKCLCCYDGKEVKLYLKEFKNPIKPYDLEIEDKLSTADIHRLAGNELFKKKLYTKATKKYTCALKYSDAKYGLGPREQEQLREASVPIQNNLAAISLLQNNYHDCIDKTTEVLRTQSDNAKALTRRLKAFTSIHEYDKARTDLETLTKVDPTNAELAALKYFIESTVAKGEKSNKKAFTKMFQ